MGNSRVSPHQRGQRNEGGRWSGHTIVGNGWVGWWRGKGGGLLVWEAREMAIGHGKMKKINFAEYNFNNFYRKKRSYKIFYY